MQRENKMLPSPGMAGRPFQPGCDEYMRDFCEAHCQNCKGGHLKFDLMCGVLKKAVLSDFLFQGWAKVSGKIPPPDAWIYDAEDRPTCTSFEEKESGK